LVFATLADPARRRILVTLSDGRPRTATQLTATAQKRLDATLKHLVALRTCRMIVTEENPVDGRRQLYRLAPAIPVTVTAAGGREFDFGCCLVRC
jgi:DNA-binding transcriptional ArsR family regulator